MTRFAPRYSVFKHATPPVGVYGKLVPLRGTGQVAFRAGQFGKLLVLVPLASPCPDLTLVADKATSPLKHPETTEQHGHEHHHGEERP
jgi:hypothetical protein